MGQLEKTVHEGRCTRRRASRSILRHARGEKGRCLRDPGEGV